MAVPWVSGIRLECPFSHVLDLQCAAGSGSAGELSLLAYAKVTPRQIPCRLERAIGESSGATGGSARAARYMDSCGVGRRGSGDQRFGAGTGEAISAASIGNFDDDGFGSEAGSSSFRRGECILLSA